MNRNEFFAEDGVAEFAAWLGELISGRSPLNFNHVNGNWHQLSDCLAAYAWPARTNNGPQPVEPHWRFPEGATFYLPSSSTLADNNVVLKRLGTGLRNALNAGQDSAPWAVAILVWGGVYHNRGGQNRAWVHANRQHLNAILTDTKAAFLRGDDEIDIPELRFNSGLTKVYSAMVDDFVMYDSRVAAAIAWLVYRKFGARIPPELRFPCMRDERHCRNPYPGEKGFPWMNARPYLHAKWNQRANWILSEAFALAHDRNPVTVHQFSDLRDVEAALFTMGYDLSTALA